MFDKAVRKYYSSQTQTQLDIGLEVAEFAKEDIRDGVEPSAAMLSLVRKVLDRDEGWKQYYTERMGDVKPATHDRKMLEVYETELQAEQKSLVSRRDEAAAIVQKLIDAHNFSEQEKGWYLQEMARYMYLHSKAESKKLQLAAHSNNRFLLKPKEGVSVMKLEVIPLKRVEAIAQWVQVSPDFDDLMIRVDGIMTDLRFGGDSDRFEAATKMLGQALGFSAERPDKEWGEGPDVLWCLRDNEYLLIECKNRVDLSRETIVKSETGQMNNSCAWFKENYGVSTAYNRLIFPSRKLGKGAGFNEEVEITRSGELTKLVKNSRRFFNEFRICEFGELDPQTIQSWLVSHELETTNLISSYSKTPVK